MYARAPPGSPPRPREFESLPWRANVIADEERDEDGGVRHEHDGTQARTTKRSAPMTAAADGLESRCAARRGVSHGLVKPRGKDVYEVPVARDPELPAVLAREPLQAALGVAEGADPSRRPRRRR